MREGGGPSMAPDAAATGGEQGEPPAAAAKTKAGPRLGGRGDGRGHAIQSQRKQMCESGRLQGREFAYGGYGRRVGGGPEANLSRPSQAERGPPPTPPGGRGEMGRTPGGRGVFCAGPAGSEFPLLRLRGGACPGSRSGGRGGRLKKISPQGLKLIEVLLMFYAGTRKKARRRGQAGPSSLPGSWVRAAGTGQRGRARSESNRATQKTFADLPAPAASVAGARA